MPDMLVKLYQLPPLEPVVERQKAEGISIRRGLTPERHIVVDWVGAHFTERWASETAVAFTYSPVACYLAVRGQQLLGFVCYDVTARNFLGPMGVDPAGRGQGIGAALLLACLHQMRLDGYGYAIIGWVGPADFYRKIVGATVIPDSEPGIYRGMLWSGNGEVDD